MWTDQREEMVPCQKHPPASMRRSTRPGPANYRVPYWVYRDDELLKTEQRQVFEGAVWNFLCLETEIAQPGDWRGTVVGANAGGSCARRATARSRRSRTAAPIAAH